MGCSSSAAGSTNDGSNIPSSASRPPIARRHQRCATSWQSLLVKLGSASDRSLRDGLVRADSRLLPPKYARLLAGSWMLSRRRGDFDPAPRELVSRESMAWQNQETRVLPIRVEMSAIRR